jgi:hypothetical protein
MEDKMQQKMICPHCGRCIGQFTTSNNEVALEVLESMPLKINKKEGIYDRNCQRCKKQIYIKMQFIV